MMSNQPNIIRRYTPPTCSLNIIAKASPLSRWLNRPIVQALQFELNFDDPRLLDHEQVSIKGNHHELEALCEVVGQYVQNFLGQSFIPSSSTINLPQEATSSTLTHLSLQPTDRLFHELNLGELGQNTNHQTVKLSSSQLFDLANTLEDYQTDLHLLPSLSRSTQRQTLLLWGSLAATVLLALAIPTIWIPWFQAQSEKNSPVASKTTKPEPDNSFLDVTPPVPPAPKEILPSPNVPPNLASKEQLPPPPSAENLPTPSRPSRNPLVIPPNAVLPPSPVVPPAPPRQVITLTPQAPSGSNQITIIPSPKQATAEPNLSPPTGQPVIPDVNFPQLPPLKDNKDNTLQARQKSASPSPIPQRGLLEPIPQVTEIRTYFEKNWNPPTELKQTLEYRLILAQNGSLTKITPLGKAAILYQSKTAMPSVGQPFVSPSDLLENETIRLVLTPKGEVKTFLEER